jgi:hypothetical protein
MTRSGLGDLWDALEATRDKDCDQHGAQARCSCPICIQHRVRGCRACFYGGVAKDRGEQL